VDFHNYITCLVYLNYIIILAEPLTNSWLGFAMRSVGIRQAKLKQNQLSVHYSAEVFHSSVMLYQRQV